MKLKEMYACVTRRPDSDGAYEPTETKPYQTKKSNKTDKRKNVFGKPKWQHITKTRKSPPRTPPKSPCKIETPPPPSTPPPPVPVEQPPLAPKRNSPRSKSPVNNKDSATANTIMDRRASPGLPSPIKPVTASNPFTPISDAEIPVGRNSNVWKPVFHDSIDSITTENPALMTPCLRYDVVAADETTSSWPNVDVKSLERRVPSRHGDAEDQAIKLIQALNFTSLQQQTSRENTNRPISQTMEHDFEDLKNEMMKKYGFVGVNGAVSFKPQKSLPPMSSLSLSAAIVTSSGDVPHSQQQPATVSCKQPLDVTRNKQKSGFEVTDFSSSATLPSSNSDKDVNWSDIPPLVPPREPVRPSRNSPPHHRSITPSPTSTSPPSSTTSFSSMSPFESTRPKHQTQSCTTTVFSAMPPRDAGSNPIILPIMKDGKQESFTHYYLLGDEKSIPKSQRPSQPKFGPLNGIARPTPSAMVAPFSRSCGSPPPRPPPPTSTMFNLLPCDSNRVSNTTRSLTPPVNSTTSSHPASTYPPRRSPPAFGGSLDSSINGRSRTLSPYSEMGPSEKVIVLVNEVFGVTTEDCQSALRHNSWDVEKAMKFLKVKQLSRSGLSTEEGCRQILETNNWDLVAASSALVSSRSESRNQQNRTTRS